MKKILTIAILCIVALSAWAVPADPRPHTYVQPNGDTLTVRLRGDEHFHFHTTLDGHLIKQAEDGYFYYATWHYVTDAKGKTWKTAVPTKVVAKNADKRDDKEVKWLTELEETEAKNLEKEQQRLQKKRLVEAKQREIKAKKALRKEERAAKKEAKRA